MDQAGVDARDERDWAAMMLEGACQHICCFAGGSGRVVVVVGRGAVFEGISF